MPLEHTRTRKMSTPPALFHGTNLETETVQGRKATTTKNSAMTHAESLQHRCINTFELSCHIEDDQADRG